MTLQQKDEQRTARRMVLLGQSLTRTAGAPVNADSMTRDDNRIPGNTNPTGRPAIIATWAPKDDETITTTLTTKGWKVLHHETSIPDLGTGDGERAGAILVPPALN